jgi:hypothetical protein
MIRTMEKLLLAAAMFFTPGAPAAQAISDVRVKTGMTYRFEDGKFTASIDGNQLVYRFTVALTTPPANPGVS